jgi:hypothetical protein
MHPLVNSFKDMKDSEIEAKIIDLTKKYFMTPNTEVKNQIKMVLDSYMEEIQFRRETALKKAMADKELDNLIKVN